MKNLYVVYSLNEKIVTFYVYLSDKVELRHSTIYSERVLEEVRSMEQYVRPEILATYTEEELVEEAAVCLTYGPVSTDGGN